MFQNLKTIERNDYSENVWYSTRLKELVDSGMKKKEAVVQMKEEAMFKPWEKKND